MLLKHMPDRSAKGYFRGEKRGSLEENPRPLAEDHALFSLPRLQTNPFYCFPFLGLNQTY